MDGQRFDDLTRTLGRRHTRRGVLRTMGAALLVAAGLGRVPGAAAQRRADACATWCAANLAGRAAGQCAKDAAAGTGVCYQCGPAAPPNHGLELRNGVCQPAPDCPSGYERLNGTCFEMGDCANTHNDWCFVMGGVAGHEDITICVEDDDGVACGGEDSPECPPGTVCAGGETGHCYAPCQGPPLAP